MNDEAAAKMRELYLTRLDVSMRDIPHGVAQEIRAGIAEELDSASPEELTDRLERLGDPEEIAREASRAGSAELPAAMPAPSPAAAAGRPRTVSAVSTRGSAIMAALVLGFGTFLVPVVGWVFGVVLVCLSRLWRTSEKVAAILVPFGSVLVIGALAAAGWSSGQPQSDGAGVIPVGPHVAWALVVTAAFFAIPASGLWLIWRLRGRPELPVS